ncbi:MAG: DUF3592 domain-containing protein [Pyrinomonadaceae bacterium]
MGFFDIFKRQPKVDLEARRCENLARNGRITEGTILDSETTGAREEIVYYHYSVHGANFESSEILSEDKLRDSLKYAPGAKVGVRYDPKNHGNSMLVVSGK